MKKLVFTFGRMNPPTIGHEKLANKIKDVAKKENATPRIYLSHSQNPKKDPLSYNDKYRFATKAFGIVQRSNSKQIFQILPEIEKEGFTDIIMVVGSDRISEFDRVLKKYNGKDYNFNSIKTVSSGDRDPDAQGVEGMSGSKLRQTAKDGDEKTFKSGLASKLSNADKTKIYNLVRKNLKEAHMEWTEEDELILAEALEELELTDQEEFMFAELGEMYELNEVLNFQQRLKKSRLMKRLAPKIARMRKIAAKKMKSTAKLFKLAQKAAIRLVRKKVAGKKGENYANLSPADKMNVDKKVQMKKPMIQKIARRLLPSVRKSTMDKIAQARKGNRSESLDEDGCPIDLFDHVLEEAEYQGKKVTLNDPIRSSDGKRKFHVYVKNEKGNVIKLGFGDPNMEIKRDDPARRKSFRARHNCDNPGPKYKARYWSCFQWRGSAKVDNEFVPENIELDEAKVSVYGFISTGARKKFLDNLNDMRLQFTSKLMNLPQPAPPSGVLKFDANQSTIEAIIKFAKRMKLKIIKEEVELDEAKKFKTDKKLPNLRIPVSGKKGKMIGKVPASHRDTDATKKKIAAEKEAEKQVDQDRDVKDKPGSQPKVYFKGVSKKTKDSRADAFRSGSSKHHDDPSAYPKSHPGDKDAKTKLSKHTKKYRAMFGEAVMIQKAKQGDETELVGLYRMALKLPTGSQKQKEIIKKISDLRKKMKLKEGDATDRVNKAIDTEKQRDAVKFDRMKDRARSADAAKKNRETKPINNSEENVNERKKGLWDRIRDKRASGRKMNPKGHKDAPTDDEIKRARGESYDYSADMTEDATAALKKKAEKSGMPLGILRKVYNRGMAAWRTGHRPGASQQQWAFARVNSFITKGSGTWGKADKDLAAKVRGSKKESIHEVGGAGEEGTKGLLARYQKDTPGQGQVIEKEYNPDDDFSGKIKKKLKELLNTDNRSKK